MVLIDNENTIKLFNPAAANILGWDAGDAIGLHYGSILKLIDNKELEISTESSVIQQSINTNTEIRPPTLTLKTKNDRKILVSLIVSPIGEMGQGVIVVFRDVTKEKAEEREQAEFISTASHEMRTPVASIEGYLGLALNPNTATIDARAFEYLKKAQSSAKHLGSLFQDLLDISKADENQLISNPEPTEIVGFLNEVVDSLKVKASEKGLDLNYIPESSNGITKIQPIYYANVDQNYLRELVSNLTENAIKYTQQGGVSVDVSGDNDHIIISINDTGIGIHEEDLPHLFQKFYRASNKETNEIGGTGLGLYLARKLAEVLNGRLWAESQYGKGSTFFIELPRISAQEGQKIQERQPEPVNVTSTSENLPVQPIPTPAATSQTIADLASPVEPTSPMSNYSVPRGEVLTPEQKAAYVERLRRLSQSGGQ